MMTLVQLALLVGIALTYNSKNDGLNYPRLVLMTMFSFSAGINVSSWINLALYQVFIRQILSQTQIILLSYSLINSLRLDYQFL
jgi:hypothetical protein